ncbi:MAG: isopentenyl phosphate kinase family protein [Anaerolineales bacterium]|nr:isopentenyl phosphate kinase family protein [Anaerolineales bacterium]
MIFLKLGGSLITDKAEPETVRESILHQVAGEIAAFLKENPSERLLLGHGSGSFGHFHASKYNTHLGATSSEEWHGFSEVWASANKLNTIVMETLRNAGVPAVRFSPSSTVVAENGRIASMEIEPILHCLNAGLLPVVHGDTAFDRKQGATILSTEAVFLFLAGQLKPDRILLAGIESGVYQQYTDRKLLLSEITPSKAAEIDLRGSEATDVTGGMLDKVSTALELLKKYPWIQIHIFSGVEPGAVYKALTGEPGGTRISQP